MRTTLDLDPELLGAARRRARELGITLRAVVEQALAAALAHRPDRKEPYRLEWKTRSGRPVAGVDVSDRDALYDVMEGRR